MFAPVHLCKTQVFRATPESKCSVIRAIVISIRILAIRHTLYYCFPFIILPLIIIATKRTLWGEDMDLWFENLDFFFPQGNVLFSKQWKGDNNTIISQVLLLVLHVHHAMVKMMSQRNNIGKSSFWVVKWSPNMGYYSWLHVIITDIYDRVDLH